MARTIKLIICQNHIYSPLCIIILFLLYSHYATALRIIIYKYINKAGHRKGKMKLIRNVSWEQLSYNRYDLALSDHPETFIHPVINAQ